MKNKLLFLSVMILAQSAFSMTNTELTGKVISDKTFIQAVETSIKGIFNQPSQVVLKFSSAGAKMNRAPYFYADFKYAVKAGSVGMGLCSFTVLGVVQNDTSLLFKKIAHEDCGE